MSEYLDINSFVLRRNWKVFKVFFWLPMISKQYSYYEKLRSQSCWMRIPVKYLENVSITNFCLSKIKPTFRIKNNKKFD